MRATVATAAATRFTLLFLSDEIHDDADNGNRQCAYDDIINRFHILPLFFTFNAYLPLPNTDKGRYFLSFTFV